LLLFVIGGFAAVYLYQRRTHDFLSVRGGLQIGWMTGLFCFLVLMVMLTFVLAIFSALGDAGLKQLASDSGHPQVAEDVSSMLSDPALLVCVWSDRSS
jgi:Na+/proline symporter